VETTIYATLMDLFLIVKQDFRNLRNYPQRTNKVRETNDQREDSAHLKKGVWINPNKKPVNISVNGFWL